MRARSASRSSLAHRTDPASAPDKVPVARLCPPHRATRRQVVATPTPEAEGRSPRALSALLGEGLVSVGRGSLRHLRRAAREAGLGLGALARGRIRLGVGRLGRSAMQLALLVLDAVWGVGARLVSGVQTRLGVEPPGSPLSAGQRLALRRVFGDSIDYERVCLKTGRLGVLAWPRRAFALGHTLYVPAEYPSFPVLLRELGRVWQYQHGGTDYGGETLGARWFAERADWRTVLDTGHGWARLDPEQQLQFLWAAHGATHGFTRPGACFIDRSTGRDYTEPLQVALAQLRAGLGAP